MPKKLTVTIGIPAHNEERNIGNLLAAISQQVQDGYSITNVFVACDGCSDNTAKIAQKMTKKLPYLQVINDGLRKGQAQRLNDFYQNCRSEIFITFDADIRITDPYLISKLVKPFQDKQVGLVGGNNLPAKSHTLVQRGVAHYELMWKSMIHALREGHNVHNHPGCISAVRTAVVKKHLLPSDVVANDHYLYFFAIKNGWKFVFARDAVVEFQVPDNLSDFVHQTSRFSNSVDTIFRYFGDVAEAEYLVPRSTKLQTYYRFLLSQPLDTLWSLSLQLLQRLSLPFMQAHGRQQVWQHITSSKGFA